MVSRVRSVFVSEYIRDNWKEILNNGESELDEVDKKMRLVVTAVQKHYWRII